MPEKSNAIALLAHILGLEAAEHDKAAAWLEAALLREVEPLKFVAHHSDLDENVIYQRAAEWCGIAFSPVVPRDLPATAPAARADAIANVMSVRTNLYGRDVLFTSGGVEALVRIRSRVLLDRQLADRICLVPPRAFRANMTDRSTALLLETARTRLAQRWPFASAHLDLTMSLRIVFTVVLTSLVLIASLSPFFAQPVLIPIMAFLLLVPSGLRLIAALNSAMVGDDDPIYPPIAETDFPVYTILLPLRDEAHMVPQLANAMKRLNYPPEKLDIKFVVESASEPTLRAVENELGDPRFELIIVAESSPATKPKALNYSLPLARGEFAVIYDAEDIPDADQLRRVLQVFRARHDLDCLQAELVIDNADENWLTSLFAAEYAGQFGLVLPALARWNLPMPLGGTSNHFRVQSLREVGGWDAFNVTEDADLGVRLSRLRYRSSTITSQTREEAPLTLRAWLGQRTRWTKGWMQTFLVHNRNPIAFAKDIGLANFLAFQAYVGGMIVSGPLHVIFIIAFIARFLLGHPVTEWPFGYWDWAAMAIFLTGYCSTVLIAMMGLNRLGLNKLLAYPLMLPFYWIFTSIASLRAIYELIRRPYFWAKTPHGLTKISRGDR